MRTTHTFFCDETGSTGAQLHSKEQPMFADGGWIVAHEDCSSAMRLIEQLEAQSGCQGTELKGSKLVKHARGQALLRKASDQMGQFAVPSIPPLPPAAKATSVDPVRIALLPPPPPEQ